MRGINRVQLLGKLGLDPDLQHTNAGVPVCNLRVATNEMFTNASGTKQTAVEWHNVTVWGKLGTIAARRLCTGCAVYVDGRLESHKYTNKNGQESRSWNVVAEKIIFLSTEDDFEYEEE